MLAKCANPKCSTDFRYLEEGKLFRLDHDSAGAGEARPEYFWLCRRCSQTMTLRLDETSGVRLMPLQRAASTRESPEDFVVLDRRQGRLLNGVSFWSHGPARRSKSLRRGGTSV